VADLLQFLVSTPVQPQAKFYSGGVLTDLDGPAGGACTVTLANPDGSTGPAAGAITHAATGIYSFMLDGPADPFWYDITSSGTIGGKNAKVTMRVEALGEHLFNMADLRDLRVAGNTPFENTVTFPDSKIHEARTAVLEEFTRILGFSPVPRFAHELLSGNGRASLFVRNHKCRDLLAVTVDGAAQDVADFDLEESGELVWPGGRFPATRRRNVAVEYSHGWGAPMGDGSNIAIGRAAMILQPGLPSTATTISTPDGMSYTYDRAGSRNRAGDTVHFGVGFIAEWLNRHSAPSIAVA
jgi:hypothetical protein